MDVHMIFAHNPCTSTSEQLPLYRIMLVDTILVDVILVDIILADIVLVDTVV